MLTWTDGTVKPEAGGRISDGQINVA